MKIIMCNSGLGNQVFQYIFSRWLELATGDVCYLDDSGFWSEKVEHNGFEIPKVFPNAKFRLLSQMFDEDVWAYMLSRRKEGVFICQQIKDSGEEIAMAAETTDYQFDGIVIPVPVNAYFPLIANCKGNIYFHGYWINKDWLKKDYFDILKKELEFTPLTEEHNLQYAKQMEESCSISVHIRRGDFVKLHWDRPPEEYKVAIGIAEQNLENAHYFVFSDDLPWCREHSAELGLDLSEERVTFVEGNRGESSFRDMQLMSLCKGNILVGGSSFSYLAALLNVHAAPIIINGTSRQA